MARGRSGSIERPDGSIYSGDVVLVDPRAQNLRELLIDLSRPGLCIVLGAGASYELIPPLSGTAALASIRAQTKGAIPVLDSKQRLVETKSPEVRYLNRPLCATPSSSLDRVRIMNLRRAGAIVALTDLFTPQKAVPSSLIDIYNAIESARGCIISFNYDGIDQLQHRFPVIYPHGQRPIDLIDPVLGPFNRKLALDFGYAPAVTWHLPFPEDCAIQAQVGYRAMERAWGAAASIVFVGYRFGGGLDRYSFDKFGSVLRAGIRVHVLCPPPDNADLRKQVLAGLKYCGPGVRVFGQPFSWRNFTQAALSILKHHRRSHIRCLIGHESALLRDHDRELGPIESATPAPVFSNEVLLNIESDRFTSLVRDGLVLSADLEVT